MVACEWFHIDWMDLPQGKRSVGPYRCTSSSVLGFFCGWFFFFILGRGSACKTFLFKSEECVLIELLKLPGNEALK